VASQFPEKYSLDFWIERYKQMPPWAWQREYMCKPVGDSTAVFPSISVDAACKREWAPLTPEETRMRNFYLGGDIAFGEGLNADYSAYYFIEKVPGRPLNVFRHEAMRGVDEEQQTRLIKNWHSQFKFHKIVLEQKGLTWSMVNKLKADDVTRGYIYPFDTNHSNKEKLVSSLSMILKDGQLRFDQPWKETIQQLSSFGIRVRNGKQTFEALSGHDDEVMGLALACEAAGGWVNDQLAPVTATWI
jgi:hypothetical protein